MPTSRQMPHAIAVTGYGREPARVGERVHERARADVVDLALRRDERARRREQHHEIERLPPKDLVEHECAVDLGGEHFLDVALALELESGCRG